MRRVHRLGCLLALAAPTLHAQTPEDLIRDLGGQDGRARYDAYRKLQTRRSPATLAQLVRALPGFPYNGQSLGISLVTSYPEKQRDPALRRLLAGPPGFVRLAAAAWFRQRGDTSMDRHIVACLSATSAPNTLSGMLYRLHGKQGPEVVAAVTDKLHRGMTAQILDPALRILQGADSQDANDHLAHLVKEGELPVDSQALAAAFLVMAGRAEHVEHLAKAIPRVRNFSQLRTLLQKAPRLPEPILDAVLEFAMQAKGFNTRYALELLAHHAHRKAVPKMIEMLESTDVETSKAAFQALITMGEGLSPKRLKRLLTAEKAQMRLAAADALRRLDDDAGLPVVLALSKGDPRLRADATEALGKFRDPRAVDALIGLLADQDTNVRTRAFRGLQTVLPTLFPYRRFDLTKTGYQPNGAATSRAQGLAVIRGWWQTHRPK